ncbi:MAG: SDR family NAD(P)-dependent oxidoreductase [Lachnospiraceae bacterium]|nr:SDR family NAD(P)-dependent oxidoreductase [Lachnospiraceae bacterium]
MRPKALVTGASRGIGKAIAYMLAEEGYDLYLVCRYSEKEINGIRNDLISQHGISCIVYLCDVSDADAVKAFCKEIGEVDVLINNAAVAHVGLLTEMSVTQWKQVIGTNLDALFYTCKYLVPGMVRKKKGKIINISSVWGNVGASTEVAYSAAKGGVNSFTKALAKELAPSNIQVNAIAFGVIDTDMNACFSEEEKAALAEEIPADRMGTVKEAAQMVKQILHSPDYLTGQVITMDGGWI